MRAGASRAHTQDMPGLQLDTLHGAPGRQDKRGGENMAPASRQLVVWLWIEISLTGGSG